MRRRAFKALCAFILILGSHSFVFLTYSCAQDKEPLKIYVGLYPIRMYQLNLKDEQFQADFYVWFRWKGPEKLPGFEIMNGDYEEVGDPETDELPGGYHYQANRIKGTFFINVNLKDYPFDKHYLEVHIENQEMDRSEAVYLPDYKNLKDLRRKSIMTGWETIALKMFESTHTYNTNFGKEGEESSSTYSQLVYQFKVERKILPYIIKYTIPLLVIVFMCFSTFFFHPSESESRIAIVITAILSVVAFHISQADALPEVGYLVTADHFFLSAYIFCAISMIVVIITDAFVAKEKVESAISVDRKARVLMPVFYFMSFIIIILAKL